MKVFTKTPAPGESPGSSGKLALRISGFSQQELVSIPQVVRSIEVLPGFHLEGLRELVYSPEALLIDPYMPRLGASRKGEFKQRERRIFFYGFDTPDLFHQILYHEIGHYVFFLVISSRVKKRWVTEIFPRSECITPYGSLNASEDFAETYACYVRDPDSLKKRLPLKFAFMRDSIFSGRAETLKRNELD